jgi:hypothetical protein
MGGATCEELPNDPILLTTTLLLLDQSYATEEAMIARIAVWGSPGIKASLI